LRENDLYIHIPNIKIFDVNEFDYDNDEQNVIEQCIKFLMENINELQRNVTGTS